VPLVRRSLTILLTLAVALAGMALLRPADATTRRMPGAMTGYAFDACQAPSQAAMDAWWQSSPYWGVGIYTSGRNRFCDVQVELSPEWVAAQSSRGWRLVPIHVGLQASCSDPKRDWERIDPNPAGDYAAARAQGTAEADEAAAAARAYGIGAGSTLWYDLEAFSISDSACRDSALALVSAWTDRLHAAGYKSGYYSSAASGIKMLDDARVDTADHWVLPDQIWIAHYVSRDDCKLRWGTTSTEYISDDGWQRDRMRQFCGTHTETHGGVSISIDSNYMDFGKGSDPKGRSRMCHTDVDFPRYPGLHRGDRGDRVKALQCFLRKGSFYNGRVHGRYHQGTAKAVERLQRRTDTLSITGKANRKTWTALLAKGSDPLLKYGSRANSVRRLQRTLNAAEGARIDVTGVFDRRTQRMVKRYQKGRDLPRTGVVTTVMWDQLQQGRR
jgi:Domain of unknown function (DUF1906)/Putative peptidoglycan binding domain